MSCDMILENIEWYTCISFSVAEKQLIYDFKQVCYELNIVYPKINFTRVF